MRKIEEVTIKLFDYTGDFAENKDVARTLREKFLLPTLKEKKRVILDYSGVTSTTQSFTHALISELIRTFGNNVFNKLFFKNCSETVKKVIGIVAEYMQRDHE